jgi:hypothetical protein
MSNLYGTTQIKSMDEIANSETLQELFMIDDLLNGTPEMLEEFCNSEEAKILVEAGKLDKRIITKAQVRQMDLNRRIKLTAYQLAKDANDPNWTKLVKYQKLKKQYAQKILTKYGKKAERIAKIQQKQYIKSAKKAVDNAKSDK